MQPVIVFRNRMSQFNWALIALGVAAAVPLLLADGADLAAVLTFAAASLLALAAFAVGLIAWLGRRQVAELTLIGDMAHIEMLSAIGRGRVHKVPIAQLTDWRWQPAWTRKLGGTGARTLSFALDGTRLTMPLFGASLFNPEALRPICPQTIAALMDSVAEK